MVRWKSPKRVWDGSLQNQLEWFSVSVKHKTQIDRLNSPNRMTATVIALSQQSRRRLSRCALGLTKRE